MWWKTSHPSCPKLRHSIEYSRIVHHRRSSLMDSQGKHSHCVCGQTNDPVDGLKLLEDNTHHSSVSTRSSEAGI